MTRDCLLIDAKFIALKDHVVTNYGAKVVNYIDSGKWKIPNLGDLNLMEKSLYEELGSLLKETCIQSFLNRDK